MFLLAKDETEELVTNCDRFAGRKHSTVPMRAFSEATGVKTGERLRNREYDILWGKESVWPIESSYQVFNASSRRNAR